MKYLILLPFILLIGSCRPEAKDPGSGQRAPLEPMASPARGPAGEPNLFAGPDGTVYLSWIAYQDDRTDALMFASWRDEKWSSPRKVAEGADWFVNWADFPSLAVYPEGQAMAAHWLAKSPNGDTYDYNVVVSQSSDEGQTWAVPFMPHADIPSEHGFVTLLPLEDKRMMAVWLDGRFTKQGNTAGSHDSHGGHGGGAMTLRTATFDPEGALYDEAELDHRVCDCCQTDAALTSRGPVVVYRNRSGEGEIRDIYITRRVDGKWTPPAPVFSDDWHMPACPVNGPAIDAAGESLALAWFTSSRDTAQVKVAFSGDAGATFSAPVRIDGGKPAGRVDLILLAPGLALVTWLENMPKGAEIRAVRVSPQGIIGRPMKLANTSESRRSGFPIIVRAREEVLMAWTEVGKADDTRVRIGRIRF